MSIFDQYYANEKFQDRFLTDSENAIDVIIPVIHTNALWRANLVSIFREIPVNRLLLGDGGCVDDTLAIAKEFPRVEVIDHSNYKTLGYSICKLIEDVQTEMFIYLHSDVFIPEGFFEKMIQHKDQYDWFETSQQITALIEYHIDIKKHERGFGLGGSQMGRKSAFESVLPKIDDDFLYRNEDIIIRKLLTDAGGRYGQIDDVFHYHQLMFKETPTGRNIESLALNLEVSDKEKIRTNTMQVKGFIKYLEPNAVLIKEANRCLMNLLELKALDWSEFYLWVKETNPVWLPHLHKKGTLKQRFIKFGLKAYKKIA